MKTLATIILNVEKGSNLTKISISSGNYTNTTLKDAINTAY